MKVPNAHRRILGSGFVIIAIVLAALVGTAALVLGKSSRSTISITVKNQTQRQIRHLYLAPGDPNNWGPDQLNGSTIQTGGSYTLNAACEGSSLRVVAEDANGCFVYYNAACDSNQTWEITDAATPDCGG